jgi:hypothetical protein
MIADRKIDRGAQRQRCIRDLFGDSVGRKHGQESH